MVAGFIAWTIKLTTDPHQLLFHPGTVGPAVAQVWYGLPEWLRSDGVGALLSLAWLFVACLLMTREVRTWPREAVRAARIPEVIAATVVITWLLPAGVPHMAPGVETALPVAILGGIVLVAFGVLVDTIIVRSLLVPAMTIQIGNKIWWPSKLARHTVPAPPPAAPDKVDAPN